MLTFAWAALGRAGETVAPVWPSVLAIALAFISRNIHLSLLGGGYAGAVLLNAGNPLTGFFDLFERHLLPALSDPWNIRVLAFTLMMGGFVELLNVSGGMQSLAGRILRGSNSQRRAGLGIYAMGWLLFIDGLANAMLVGKSMRPIADRVRMSREKLAFIVDSTSSPIAGLSLVSTWVAYELSVIREGLTMAGESAASAFPLLVESIPHRFYNLYLLLIVLLVIWLGRDFKAMRQTALSPDVEKPDSKAEEGKAPWWPTIVSLALLVLGVFGGLYLQGGGSLEEWSLQGAIDAFGSADAALVFVWATAGASLLAMALNRIASVSEGKTVQPFLEGMNHMFLPALILVFAWTLNSVLKELETAASLVALLGGAMPAGLLPVLTFALGAVISFSTGTSWGTMAILMPLVIPLGYGLAEASGIEAHGLIVTTIGAVLAGAVFGDHCSPISDTTIVSSFSSGCDAMAHVRTQLPYAFAAAVIAVLIGYLPTGWNVPPWLLLPFGVAACWSLIRYRARPASG